MRHLWHFLTKNGRFLPFHFDPFRTTVAIYTFLYLSMPPTFPIFKSDQPKIQTQLQLAHSTNNVFRYHRVLSPRTQPFRSLCFRVNKVRHLLSSVRRERPLRVLQTIRGTLQSAEGQLVSFDVFAKSRENRKNSKNQNFPAVGCRGR